MTVSMPRETRNRGPGLITGRSVVSTIMLTSQRHGTCVTPLTCLMGLYTRTAIVHKGSHAIKVRVNVHVTSMHVRSTMFIASLHTLDRSWRIALSMLDDGRCHRSRPCCPSQNFAGGDDS